MESLNKQGVVDQFKEHFALLISPNNRRFLYLAIVYGLAISLLTLAVPVSVQMLINTVANIASINAILILAFVLFALLVFSGIMILFQTYALELFERRLYAALTAQLTLRYIAAKLKNYRQINGNDLVNRYFDIMQLQKIMSLLIAGLAAVLLQMFVGILLVSFYHPWLFLFNLVFMLLLLAACWYWGKRAMKTALYVSEAKYDTARHLEDMAYANDLYKSGVRSKYAVNESNRLIDDYIDYRRRHFRNVITQKGALLALYALASSALLGLGGILVVRAELTLGQLVAAELILSAVFFAISNLSNYLVQFYDLTAALEEINRVYEMPLEQQSDRPLIACSGVASVQFDGVQAAVDRQTLAIDFGLKAGDKMLIKADASSVQRGISDILQCHVPLDKGRVLLGEEDLLDYDPSSVRDQIAVIDKTFIIESRIIDYMRIYAPDASRAAINDLLEVMDLKAVIDSLPEGIETTLLTSGYPFRASELLRLKLAAAMLSQPSMIILNEYFDSISYVRRQRIFNYLCSQPDLTLLYFSNRQDLNMFDRYGYFTLDDQYEFASVEELRAFEDQREEAKLHD